MAWKYLDASKSKCGSHQFIIHDWVEYLTNVDTLANRKVYEVQYTTVDHFRTSISPFWDPSGIFWNSIVPSEGCSKPVWDSRYKVPSLFFIPWIDIGISVKQKVASTSISWISFSHFWALSKILNQEPGFWKSATLVNKCKCCNWWMVWQAIKSNQFE